MKQRKVKQGYVFLIVFLLSMPLLQAGLLSVETLSPSSATLCGAYSQNVTITAQNVENTGNQTIENVTAILISEPNSGVSIIGPSLYLGSVTPGILAIDPSWQVQCADQNINLPGTFTLYVNFSTVQGNLASSKGEAESIITVYANDNTPPLVVSHSPLGVVPTSYVTLEIITTEDATCRYSTIPGIGYDHQQYTFQITGGKSHKVPLQNLVDNFYNYYVRCKDQAGNEAQSDYVASIEINAPPTATISLSKPSPLTVGTTGVTITTSEPVKPVPTLSYSCNGNAITVPLTGSSASWKGYIILSQTNVHEVCSFSFSSTDLSGNAGSYITNGNVFLIDTVVPDAPTSLSAVEQRGLLVKLAWKLPSEEVKNFNIYRRPDESSEFLYHGTTTRTSFTDTVVSVGKTYVYHVSAVDEAGNEGPFSEEVSIQIKGIALNEDAVIVENSGKNSEKSAPNVKLTVAEIDKTIAEADSLLDEFNALRTKFKSETVIDNEAFLLLEPSERMKEAKVLLLKKKEELGLLKSADLTDESVKEEFQAIQEEFDKIKDTVIADIKVEAEELFTAAGVLNEELVSTVVTQYLNKKKPNINQEEKDDFLLSVQKLQSAITVSATMQEVEITYLNRSVEKFFLVVKEVKENKENFPSEAFSLLEYVPKELASSVDEMIFKKEAEVIDPDPLLQYYFPNADTFTYSYALKKEVDPEAVVNIVTVAVPKSTSVTQSITQNDARSWNALTGLTGNVVASVVSLKDTVSRYDIGITLGVLSVIILFIYSLIYSEKEISFKVQHDLPSFDAIKKYFTNRKKKKEKMELAGLARTYYAHEEYREAGLTPLLDSTLSVLLQKTEDALHDLDFEKAVKFYHLFCIQNDSPSYKKGKATLSSKRITQKMALLTKHTLLQYAVEKKEFMHLRQILNEIAELYNELLPDATEKETALLEHIRSFHSKYSTEIMKRK